MALKPDYGTYLLEQGVGSHVEQHFHQVWLDHFTLLGPNAGFTTLVTLMREGREYAASFDFPSLLWEDFLQSLPEDEVDTFIKDFEYVTKLPHTVEFTQPHPISLQAQLGKVQRGPHEMFVPLVVERVWQASEPEVVQTSLGTEKPDCPLDSEFMQSVITVGGFYVEAGAKSFSEWSRHMVNDLGEGVRPYLRWTYTAIRTWPGCAGIAVGMDSDEEIDAGATRP